MSDPSAPRRFDPVSAVLAAVTVFALAWAGWLRYGPEAALEPPGIGTPAPRVRLLDPATSEPLVLPGLHGRVIWLAFWAADGPASDSNLAAIEGVWNRLKDRPRFTLVAATVDSPPRLSQARAKPHLPVYVATPETRRAFGADAPHLPLHVLIDDTGHVGAVAQGMRPETLARLRQQAEAWLDALEPLGTTRFASSRLHGGDPIAPVRGLTSQGPRTGPDKTNDRIVKELYLSECDLAVTLAGPPAENVPRPRGRAGP